MEKKTVNYAVIHTYGYAQSSKQADLLGIYNSKEAAEKSLPAWRTAREESKKQIKRLSLTAVRKKPYIDRLVVFGFYPDKLNDNSGIVDLYLKEINKK